MDYAYSKDFGIGEENLDKEKRGYSKQLQDVIDEIDHYLNYIANYVESLRQSPEDWDAARKELEMVIAQYEEVRMQAIADEQGFVDQALLNENIIELLNIRDHVKKWSEQIANAINAEPQPEEKPMEDAGAPGYDDGGYPLPGDNGNGEIVPAGDEDIIVMEEQGAVRAWWDGLDPSTRLVIKALMVGGALYGGKKLLDYIEKKTKSKATSEPEG